jgi:hypothetical protein
MRYELPMRFLPVLLLAVATPSFAAEQFDLQCSGSVYDGGPISRHYRVDLTANKWCANGDNGVCATRPIAETDPDLIWFEKEPRKFPSDVGIIHYVSRLNGKWYWHLGPMEVEGTCEKAPFSGFPKLDTKF